MPASLSYPGVYLEELPSGVRTITGVATSITAFLGRAVKGPTDDPVTCFNFGDYERVFGGLDKDTPLSYAVRDFFQNGGGQALVVRVHKASGDANTTTTFTLGALTFKASSPGAWANNLKVTLSLPSSSVAADLAASLGGAAADYFNLTVSKVINPLDATKDQVLESFPSLTLAAGARPVDQILSSQSQLIRTSGSLPTTVPSAASNAALDDGTKGHDSAALDSGDYLGSEDGKTALYALNKADLFNLLCIPPDTRGGDTPVTVYQTALAYCVKRRAFLIVDPPHAWVASSLDGTKLAALGLSGTDARNGAVFFPRIKESDPKKSGLLDTFVPCGVVAGIMARTDSQRGIWKAPAGLDAALSGVQDLAESLTDDQNGKLNPLGINCLRSFPVTGRVVWGSRTLRGADALGDDYRYIPVRRLALFIEESLYRGLQWVVFEPNDEPLWSQIRLNAGSFMHNLFRQGAFQGSNPKDAYFVKCDKESTTQSDINLGIVNILIGFAPLKPAEFVVVKIQQMAGQVQA